MQKTHPLAERLPRALRILILSADEEEAAVLEGFLSEAKALPGCRITRAAGVEEAAAQIPEHYPDLVVVDIDLPDTEASRAIQEIYRVAPGVPIVVLAPEAMEQDAIAALQMGANDYLLRETVDSGRLARTIRYALNGMAIRGHRHLPIVDEHDEVLGVVSVRTVLAHIRKMANL